LKIRAKSLKSWEKSGHKWRPTFAEKYMNTSSGRSHQKKVFMVFVGENVYVKVAQKLFGQVWGNSGKNPSHPPKFACYYNYVFTQGD